MKPPLHKNAVTREIDQLFMEPVTIEMGKHKGRISYQNIDYRNPIALHRLVQQKLIEYLKAHPDNTPALFIESQTEKYRKLQGYFPKYKSASTDNEARKDKEYYFALNRYLTEIERLGVNSFEQLFKEAAFYVEGLVSPYTGQKNYEVVKQLELETHKVKFSIYLADKYNITTDEIYTGHYFTKEYFLEYLKAEQERINKAKIEFEQEKQTWQITPPAQTTSKFYTDNDFSALIQEIEKLQVNRVKDILEHHYTQAYFPNSMSRFNWLNQLRALLIKAYPIKDEKPMQIVLANHWVDNIISKHVHDVNAKANNWKTPEEVKKANHDNRTELLHWLTIVKYFEEENIKVQLFTTGNEHFKAQGKLDDKEIWDAANTKNNLEIKEALRTRRLIHIEIIREAFENELESLFDEKFKNGKVYDGFKTEAKFAKHEIKRYEWQYKKYFEWFPILEQWFELLKLKAGQADTRQKAIPAPKPITEIKANPKKFKDVFAGEGWEKYIVALQNTDPPLLNESWEFIGNAKKHKGVICAWIKALQYKGIVKQTVSRVQLVFVLNSELKNFNLGKDGKTLDNISKVYDNDFKKQLETIAK